MEIMEHTITFKINDNLEYLTLSIQEAEELYNLLHKELKKDSGVVLNAPNYRDLRMPEPIYTVTAQTNTESFKPEFYVGDDINPPNLTTCRVNGGVSI